MDQPARFSFDRGNSKSPDNKSVDEKNRKVGTTFISSGIDDEYYKPIARYEGIHRYDPKFDWEPEEEKKVVRKVYLFSVSKHCKLILTISRSITEFAHGCV